MIDDDHESVLVKLTRMEGKLDLSNLRHNQHDAKFSTIDQRLNSHGDRIGGLEKREFGRDGERKGVSVSGKVMWSIGSLLVGSGGVFAIMEAFK